MRQLKITKSITNRSLEFDPQKSYPAKAEGYKELPDYVKPLIRTRISPVEIFREDFPKHEWNVSGGWGYTQDTAAVIEEDTYMHGLSLEGMFVRYRTYEELIVFQPEGQKFSGIEWKMQRQALHGGPNGKHYDWIEYLVTAFTDSDWEMLKNDFESHNGYKDDPKGLLAHAELRASKQIGFLTACWFDIQILWKALQITKNIRQDEQ